MDYLTTVEMSEKWNISPRRIGMLCADGRIDGVVKKGKTWLIPADAEKPADRRYRKMNTGNDASHKAMDEQAKALSNLQLLYELCIWFMQTYGDYCK